MNYCGTNCDECQFQSPCACKGCGTAFYGECAVEKCAKEKFFSHCGQCPSFPCPALTAAATDPFTGDNGSRLKNLRSVSMK